MENTTLVNGGDTPVRVTSVQAPTGRYSAAGLPKVGTVIKPGEAIPVQAQFTPANAGTATGSFTVTTSKGPAVTVTLSGIGLRPVDKFASVPAQVNFGSVRVGHTAKIWVDITNKGNQGAIMTGGSTQGTPFHAQLGIPKGMTVNGTEDLTVPIVSRRVRPARSTACTRSPGGTTEATIRWRSRSPAPACNQPRTHRWRQAARPGAILPPGVRQTARAPAARRYPNPDRLSARDRGHT